MKQASKLDSRWRGWIAVLVLGPLLLAPPADARARRREHGTQTPVEDWTTRESLPLLVVTELPAPPDRAPLPPEPGPQTTERFPDDEAAVRAAREHLSTRFGALPLPLLAQVQRPSATGRAQAGARVTVRFAEAFNGIPLHRCGATVAYLGKAVIASDAKPCTAALLPGTERKVLSRPEAEVAWEKFLRASSPPAGGGAVAAKLEPLRGRLQLLFVYSPESLKHLDVTEQAVAPNWVLGDDLSVLMDAYTGEVWRND